MFSLELGSKVLYAAYNRIQKNGYFFFFVKYEEFSSCGYLRPTPFPYTPNLAFLISFSLLPHHTPPQEKINFSITKENSTKE